MEASAQRPFRRPLPVTGRHFESLIGGDDPALRRELGDRCAHLLVRGPHNPTDSDAVARVVRLAETEGLELLSELWSGAAPDSLAGALWRLYVLRTWVHRHPDQAAREFSRGVLHWGPDPVVAGVVDPPGPADVQRTADEILAGAYRGDFAVALFRAAAFAAVCSRGRALAERDPDEGRADDLATARLLTMSQQLREAGHRELSGGLA